MGNADAGAYLAPKQIATELHCSVSTVMKMIGRGDLRAIRVGDYLVRVSKADFTEYLSRAEIAPQRQHRQKAGAAA